MSKIKECVCKQCGKKFEIYESSLKRGEGRYCSQQCYGKTLIVDRVTVKCDNCGKDIQKRKKTVKNKNFCNRKCYHEAFGKGIVATPKRKAGIKKLKEKKKNKIDNRGKHKSLAGTIYKPTGEVFVRHPKTGRASLKRKCICGKEFYAKKSEVELGRGKFCSKECHGKSKTTQVNCICKNCKKEFTVCRASFERGEGKFCSKKCFGESIKVDNIKLICEYCGNEFEIKPGKQKRVRNGKLEERKYCSKKCSDLSTKTGIYENCLNCGKEIYTFKHDIGKRRFCSIKCNGEYFTGENNANWNPDKAKREENEFTISQRKKILAKYGNRCAVTGLHRDEAELHIHHILPVKVGGTNDISNGIPLWVDVHKMVHYKNFDILPYIKGSEE